MSARPSGGGSTANDVLAKAFKRCCGLPPRALQTGCSLESPQPLSVRMFPFFSRSIRAKATNPMAPTNSFSGVGGVHRRRTTSPGRPRSHTPTLDILGTLNVYRDEASTSPILFNWSSYTLFSMMPSNLIFSESLASQSHRGTGSKLKRRWLYRPQFKPVRYRASSNHPRWRTAPKKHIAEMSFPVAIAGIWRGEPKVNLECHRI